MYVCLFMYILKIHGDFSTPRSLCKGVNVGLDMKVVRVSTCHSELIKDLHNTVLGFTCSNLCNCSSACMFNCFEYTQVLIFLIKVHTIAY